MSNDNHLWNMYGGGSVGPSKPAAPPPDRFKQASRVIGGLKAQNSHTKTLEIDGEYHTFPKAEYVSQMETQLREARSKLRDLETKIMRQQKAQGRILEKLRQMEMELANKIDLR